MKQTNQENDSKVLSSSRYKSFRTDLVFDIILPSQKNENCGKMANQSSTQSTFSSLQYTLYWTERTSNFFNTFGGRLTFLSLETTRNHTCPNLVNMLEGSAVRSTIRPIDDWCVVMVEKHLFFAWGRFLRNSGSSRLNNSAQ